MKRDKLKAEEIIESIFEATEGTLVEFKHRQVIALAYVGLGFLIQISAKLDIMGEKIAYFPDTGIITANILFLFGAIISIYGIGKFVRNISMERRLTKKPIDELIRETLEHLHK